MGRKKLGNALWSKRVSAIEAAALSGYLKSLRSGKVEVRESGNGSNFMQVVGPVTLIPQGCAKNASIDFVKLKKDYDDLNKKLWSCADTEEKLVKEIEGLKADLEYISQLDLDEKGKLGWRKFYEITNPNKKSEYDQEA